MSEVSASVGRYLSTIHLVSKSTGRPAKTGELATALDVSAASVTEMLTTLESRDLATYEKYKGAQLTDEGEETAREVMWKHCLAENFLEDDLEIDSPEDAREMGQALSDDVAARLRELIDHPCAGQCSAPQTEYSECCDDVRGEENVPN
ncbi:iron (metal) dependent repressor, DtxR family [Haladaptatus litoreus]|uniref:Iron (Metal) dependent repressor, DtxR family n=1 Tax=Haladaptatus litoreus TaxID=553468 RepID=A0A1N6UU67_9EURY|nr:metal-dependent transcriptional regulator [Haladaptatus litoreus]SIQ69180.1 iron (metal) dependent repressor, DtxR family [Haladaptatus litoreus]